MIIRNSWGLMILYHTHQYIGEQSQPWIGTVPYMMLIWYWLDRWLGICVTCRIVWIRLSDEVWNQGKAGGSWWCRQLSKKRFPVVIHSNIFQPIPTYCNNQRVLEWCFHVFPCASYSWCLSLQLLLSPKMRKFTGQWFLLTGSQSKLGQQVIARERSCEPSLGPDTSNDQHWWILYGEPAQAAVLVFHFTLVRKSLGILSDQTTSHTHAKQAQHKHKAHNMFNCSWCKSNLVYLHGHDPNEQTRDDSLPSQIFLTDFQVTADCLPDLAPGSTASCHGSDALPEALGQSNLSVVEVH